MGVCTCLCNIQGYAYVFTVHTQCGLCHRVADCSWFMARLPIDLITTGFLSVLHSKEYKEARNRPKDTKGRTSEIPQSIVMPYSHVKQLIEDCNQILQNSNLVLVTINNTTVSSW